MMNSSAATRSVKSALPFKGLTFVRQQSVDPQTGLRHVNYFDIAGESFADGCIEGCKALIEVLAQVSKPNGNVPLRQILCAVGSINPDDHNDIQMGAAKGFTEALEELLQQVVTPEVLTSFAAEKLAAHTQSIEADLQDLKDRNTQFLTQLEQKVA